MKILKETKLLRKIHFKRAGKIPFNNGQVDTNKQWGKLGTRKRARLEHPE